MRTFYIIAFNLAFLAGSAFGFEPIPVTAYDSALAPPYVHSMQLGAPADTIMLRVSLCFAREIREASSFIVVEELRWPPPMPKRTVTESQSGEIHTLFEDVESEWLLRSFRIPGEYLNSERRKLPEPVVPGMRAGRLGELFLNPFEFVAWLSPLEFMVKENRGCFIIKWHAPGEFELVEVTKLSTIPLNFREVLQKNN